MVVDDGSSDDTAILTLKYFDEYPDIIRLVSLTHNVGKGGAVRVGMENAHGNYILMVRTGMCVLWVQILVDHHPASDLNRLTQMVPLIYRTWIIYSCTCSILKLKLPMVYTKVQQEW